MEKVGGKDRIGMSLFFSDVHAVFPSGNVLIRFQTAILRIDLTIEAIYLSRVEVERRFDVFKCGRTKILKFYYSKLDSSPASVGIPEYCFIDNVERIAQYINGTLCS